MTPEFTIVSSGQKLSNFSIIIRQLIHDRSEEKEAEVGDKTDTDGNDPLMHRRNFSSSPLSLCFPRHRRLYCDDCGKAGCNYCQEKPERERQDITTQK